MRTCEFPNVQMSLQVHIQIDPMLEQPIAAVTFGRMNGHMRIVRFDAGESFLAHHAHVRVCVHR